MAAAATRNCAVAEHSAAEVGVAEPAVDEAVGGAVAGVVVGGPDAPPEQPTIAVNPMMLAAHSRTTGAHERRQAGKASPTCRGTTPPAEPIGPVIKVDSTRKSSAAMWRQSPPVSGD
jgi:hypothetical protein